MKDRFAGSAGRRILLETLKEQKLIAGNTELADQVASIGELVDVEAGATIIEQGNDDNDVYLIVAGSFDIVVNNRCLLYTSFKRLLTRIRCFQRRHGHRQVPRKGKLLLLRFCRQCEIGISRNAVVDFDEVKTI